MSFPCEGVWTVTRIQTEKQTEDLLLFVSREMNVAEVKPAQRGLRDVNNKLLFLFLSTLGNLSNPLTRLEFCMRWTQEGTTWSFNLDLSVMFFTGRINGAVDLNAVVCSYGEGNRDRATP